MRAKKEISVGTWLKRRGDTKDPKDAVLVVLDREPHNGNRVQVGRVDGMTPTGPQLGRRTWISDKTIQGARYVVIAELKPPEPVEAPADYEGPVTLDAALAMLQASLAETRALRIAFEDMTAALKTLHPSVQAKLPFALPPSPATSLRGSAS